MGVLAIWRYPVKAMLGELLRSAQVTAGGIAGDRRWVVRDVSSGERIASKRGPTDARLRECRARVGADGELIVTLPDGAEARGVADTAAALSELLGRDVALAEHEGGGGGFGRTGGHHDFAPLHLLTTGAIAWMRRIAPGSDWDARRFRPNLVLGDEGGDGDGAPDRELVGAELLGASGMRLRVGLPTPRCVVPTRAREELPADPAILRQVAAANRWDLGPLGRQACFGVYAEVASDGRITHGERLTVAPRTEGTPESVAAAVLQRALGR